MGMTTRSVRLLSVAILATSLAGCGKPTAAEVFDDNRDAAAQTQQQIEAVLQPLDEVGEQVGSSVLDSCVTGHRNWVSDEGSMFAARSSSGGPTSFRPGTSATRQTP